MIGNRDRFIAAIKARSLRFGDFGLKSGARSFFYLDLRALTISPDVQVAVDCLRDCLLSIRFNAIGGPSLGADPIVGGFLYSTNNYGLRGFLVRKESKGHGLAGLVVGSVIPGDRCVVVEDVTTTGSSLIHAIDAVTEFGCLVVAAVTMVDRSGGRVAPELARRSVEFRSVLTPSDLGIPEDAS